MAIYHMTVKMVKRSEGRSAVASAAYRSGSLVHEEATGITHDYSRKEGVEHSEILAPEGAPDWVFDRSKLWNAVEASEQRKDSQLAREVEVGLPIELSTKEQISLLRDFINQQFVSKGMVADFGVHLDNPNNPHAHIMLTTRDITAEGFGKKNTSWNQTAALLGWRRGWADVTNEHLARAGLGIRVDHRSYREQEIDLIPGRKIGVGVDRRVDEKLPAFLSERVAEQQRIAGANGVQIIADPGIALKALTHQQATFTHHDLGRFLHTRTENAEQFQTAYLKVTTAPEIVALGLDDAGRQRFTTKDMLGTERALLADAETLARRSGHGVGVGRRVSVLSQHRLSDEQRHAFDHVTSSGDLKALVGVAGSGKSTALSAMREAWEAEGLTVKGTALSGIAAENLQVASGINARTIASYELSWSKGHDGLSDKDVLVIDEAGMIGTRQLKRVLEAAKEARAKVVLVGDPEQLQAIEAGAPFRGIAAEHGVAELTQVRRQRYGWQREATSALSSGRTEEALEAYSKQGGIVAVADAQEAQRALLARWARDGKAEPKASQLVLAYTRDDVQSLNAAMRTLREQTGQLGASQEIATERGKKEFSVNDRVRFLRNDRTLGVKNGSLGTIEKIDGKVLQIRLDGSSDKRLGVDTKFYSHLDHGYAATVHKAQGATVDRTYVLATPHFDRHTSYVALSRHREAATVFYAKEDFGGRSGKATDQEIQARMTATLSRARPKDLAHDYLESPPADSSHTLARPPQTLEKDRRRGRFEGLNLGAAPTERERAKTPGMFDDLKLKTPEVRQEKGSERVPAAAPALNQSIDRYARAWMDAVRMTKKDLPILEHQHTELRQAGEALERLRPGAVRDLQNSISHEREFTRAMADLKGPERAAKLLAGMEHEEKVRRDPNLRAERVLKVWNGLEAQREKLKSYEHTSAREKVTEKMRELALDLKRDPQVELVLQRRGRELGIEPRSRLAQVIQERDLDRALSISERDLSRGRDLGLGR